MTDHPIEPPYFPIYGGYHGAFPAFYDTSQLEFARVLERNFPVILAELEAYRRRTTEGLRVNWDPYGFRVTGWKAINFMTWGYRYHRNCENFPQTMKIIDAIPNAVSAFLNVLDAHAHIPAHFGDSNTMWRCHLGLVIPGDMDVCGIEVGGQRSGWEEGGTIAFCDAHWHRAWNETERERVILVIDVLRPEYAVQKERMCARVLAGVALMMVVARVPGHARIPEPILRASHAVLALGFRVWIAVRRALRG